MPRHTLQLRCWIAIHCETFDRYHLEWDDMCMRVTVSDASDEAG